MSDEAMGFCNLPFGHAETHRFVPLYAGPSTITNCNERGNPLGGPMTDTSKVTPALTPEEWSWPHTAIGDNRKMGIFGRAGVREIEERDNVDPADLTVLAIIPPHTLDDRGIVCDAEQRHALAALALHGQPFGFTRQHVEALDPTSRFHQSAPRSPEVAAEHRVLMREVRDRIAALLPPEHSGR